MGKLAKVKLHGIFCSSKGSDPGANLEVYGDLWANTDSVPHELWRKSDGVNIAENNVYLDYRERVVHVKDNENLYVGGHLWEEDEFYNPDDYMARPGGNWEVIPLYLIDFNEKHFPVWFEEDGQKVRVDFTVVEERL